MPKRRPWRVLLRVHGDGPGAENFNGRSGAALVRLRRRAVENRNCHCACYREAGHAGRPPCQRRGDQASAGQQFAGRCFQAGSEGHCNVWFSAPGECCCAYERTQVRRAGFRPADVVFFGTDDHGQKNGRGVGVAGSRSSLGRARVTIWSRAPGRPAGIRREMLR
jgi:hypothetical protein